MRRFGGGLRAGPQGAVASSWHSATMRYCQKSIGREWVVGQVYGQRVSGSVDPTSEVDWQIVSV